MAGTTTELALSLAVDTDDTADYLTLNLANSLRTVDALFNNVSGHTHASAHQGGPIAASSVRGPMDIPDWFRSTGHNTVFAGSGVGIEFYWSGTTGTIQSFNRATAAYAGTDIWGSPIRIGANGSPGITVNTDNTVNTVANLTVGSNLVTVGFVQNNQGIYYFTDSNTAILRSANDVHYRTLGSHNFQHTDASRADVTVRYIHVGDGVNAVIYGDNGALYLRPPSGQTVVMDQGPLTVSGTVTAGNFSVSALSTYGLTWMASASYSIYCDTAMMQFGHPAGVWRYAYIGAGYADLTVRQITNGDWYMQMTGGMTAPGKGFIVSGTDLHGQALYVNGGAGGPTGWQTISSFRWKSNVVSISDALAIVTNPSVHGYHFDLAPPETIETLQQYGFVGEEWLPVAPDLVNTDSEGQVLFMDYGQITPIIFEALKDYIARTDARLAAAGIP